MHAPASDDLVLGIDLGTSYFKIGLFGPQGALRGLGRVSTPTQSPVPGYCEMAPDAFWNALAQGLQEAFSSARAGPDQVRGVSYSSQANSFLLQDEHAQPLTPLILWPDARTDAMDKEWAALRKHPDYTAHTGLGTGGSPRGAMNKVLAWRNETPGRANRPWRFLTISDYFVFGLTGERIGDGGTASLLGIEDVSVCNWWPEALAALHLRPDRLVRLVRPGSAAGVTTDAAARLGLPAGLPVTAGSLDHHLAAVGAGVGSVTDVSESTGTVMACLRRTDRFMPRKGCYTGPDIARGFFELAADNNGGAEIEEYRRRFYPDARLETLSREAAEVAPGSDGLRARRCAHTYPGREGFVGLRPEHGRGHEVRALFESTSASLCALVERVCGGVPERGIIATGGGSRSASWMQIKADMLGAVFHVPECPEPACRGAALLAAVGAGWFASADEAQAAWQPVFRHIQPRPDTHAFYRAWRRKEGES